jgi:hypothetical protein
MDKMEGLMAKKLHGEALQDLESKAYQIRRLSLEMICYGQWGHLVVHSP